MGKDLTKLGIASVDPAYTLFRVLREDAGVGNGNPLQCSCLENPSDRKAGGLPSMGLHRVGQDWGDLAAVAAAGSFSLQLAQKPIAL